MRGLRAGVPWRAAQHPALTIPHHREDLARAAAAHRLDRDLLPIAKTRVQKVLE
jgi:hypothetical protein